MPRLFQGTFKGVSRKFLRLLKGSFHVSHVNSDVSVTLLRTLESKAYFVKDSASIRQISGTMLVIMKPQVDHLEFLRYYLHGF